MGYLNPILHYGIEAFCQSCVEAGVSGAIIPDLPFGSIIDGEHGVHFPETDWYGFAAGGAVGSVITAAMILLITWVLALLLRLASCGSKNTR